MVLYLGLIMVSVFLVTAWVTYSIIQEYHKDRVPALLYHHFASKKHRRNDTLENYDPVYFCYDTAFDEQMKYLHDEGYTTISLDDFVAFQNGKKRLPPKPIIVTFDDGFMSNYVFAFPILKKYGMTATIFVTLDPTAENFKKYAQTDS